MWLRDWRWRFEDRKDEVGISKGGGVGCGGGCGGGNLL